MKDLKMSFPFLKKSLVFLKNQNRLLGCNRFEYQSAISLKNLYPNSNLKITTPDEKEVTKYIFV